MKQVNFWHDFVALTVATAVILVLLGAIDTLKAERNYKPPCECTCERP